MQKMKTGGSNGAAKWEMTGSDEAVLSIFLRLKLKKYVKRVQKSSYKESVGVRGGNRQHPDHGVWKLFLQVPK